MKRKNYFNLLFFFIFLGSLFFAQTAGAAFDSNLFPTDFTPSNYFPPTSDPFADKPYSPPKTTKEVINTPPTADFRIYTRTVGLATENMGTIETEFYFDAGLSSDRSPTNDRLEYRWDFENDGIFDSYFSRSRTIRHIFKNPGTYQVKLEVLDQGGNTDTIIQNVKVVQNTPPIALFTFYPSFGTPKSVFRFDTRLSFDNQYSKSSLQYRFDWNSDGKWDTPFEAKTLWQHRFDAVGKYLVTLQVQDPGGQRATYSAAVATYDNHAPSPSLIVKERKNQYGTTYELDASKSFDQETPLHRLKFRWDFNYHGPDDIVADSFFGSSAKRTVHYEFSGPKIIRLEVQDEDGVITSIYAILDVQDSDVYSTRR